MLHHNRKALLLAVGSEDPTLYRDGFHALLPELEIYDSASEFDPDAIAWVVCWLPPEGLIASLPNLEVIFSMGAGVDHILRDPTVPHDVPIVRLAHDSIGEQIRDYTIHAVLQYYRQFDVMARRQTRHTWEFVRIRPKLDFRPALLGLGETGRAAAQGLLMLGFPVMGWSRSQREIEGVRCFSGADGLDEMLARTSVLVSILPSSPDTAGILNAAVFAKLPRGAALISLGRGSHLVDADLISALDSGHLSGATLDVFSHEPLPPDDPFWRHPLVRVTPHTGSDNDPGIVVDAVAKNLVRLKNGLDAHPAYDRHRGY